MFKTPNFSLNNFDGPLELLLYLIQKEEIDVCDISLKALTDQFFDFLMKTDEIEQGAEILQLTASLLLIKSRKLLPTQESLQKEILEDEMRIELIQHVMEYCRFRQTAELLSQREEEQKAFFCRQTPLFRKEPETGLEKLSLEDLKKLLSKMVVKQASPSQTLQDEVWQIETKIDWFRKEFSIRNKISFFEIFSKDKCKAELIVFFLALLELIKDAFIKIEKEKEDIYIRSYA